MSFLSYSYALRRIDGVGMLPKGKAIECCAVNPSSWGFVIPYDGRKDKSFVTCDVLAIVI